MGYQALTIDVADPVALFTLNRLAQAVRYTTSGKRGGADSFPGKRPPSFTGS
jgi:hypothetical protein